MASVVEPKEFESAEAVLVCLAADVAMIENRVVDINKNGEFQ